MESDQELKEWIRRQPKVVLHRHLEGMVPYRLIWKYQQEGKVKTNFKTLEELIKGVSITRPMKNLQEVLDLFVIHQSCFHSLDAVTEITKEEIIDCEKEGLSKVELRFSPEYMAEPAKLDWDDVMRAVIKGKNLGEEATKGKVKVGFIIIVSRNYGPESGIKTAEFAKRWREHIVGFDFAAAEDLFPAEDFLPTVKIIKDMGLPLTVHTGEGNSAKNIEEVLRLYQPQRLGHATKLIDNEELMEHCRKHQILVESCPTSNIITNSVKSYETHPLVHYYKTGIPVCINDDDGTCFGVDQNDEWFIVMKRMGLSKEDMLKMNDYAEKFSFIK